MGIQSPITLKYPHLLIKLNSSKLLSIYVFTSIRYIYKNLPPQKRHLIYNFYIPDASYINTSFLPFSLTTTGFSFSYGNFLITHIRLFSSTIGSFISNYLFLCLLTALDICSNKISFLVESSFWILIYPFQLSVILYPKNTHFTVFFVSTVI